MMGMRSSYSQDFAQVLTEDLRGKISRSYKDHNVHHMIQFIQSRSIPESNAVCKI